jgi:hypothetical protein
MVDPDEEEMCNPPLKKKCGSRQFGVGNEKTRGDRR